MTEEQNEPRRLEGFIVMTRGGYWAWGPTPRLAVNACQGSAHSKRKGERLIYRLPAGSYDAYVDGMGSVRWQWDEDVPEADRHTLGEYVEQP